jgi:photosystem II stability/assembly factor-like uncharacterized protein
MPIINGDPIWREDVQSPGDGEPANGATFEEGYQQLADSVRFLRSAASHAIANLEEVDDHDDDVLFDVCFAPNGVSLAGTPIDGFVAAGITGIQSAIWTSFHGKAWTRTTDDTLPFILGLAHGGSGALGSRRIVYVGMSAEGQPRICTAEDAAPAVMTLQTSPAGITGIAARLVSVKWNGTAWCAAGWRASGVTALCTAPSAADTWTLRTPGDSYTGNFTKVHVHGSRIILIGEDGEVQVSNDNGATFDGAYRDATLGDLTSIVSINDDCLIITATDPGRILQSSNGGVNWDEIALPAIDGMTDAYAEHAFALGGVAGLSMVVAGEPQRVILASYDGGLTWPGRTRAETLLPYVASATDGTRLVTIASDGGATRSVVYASPRTLGS